MAKKKRKPNPKLQMWIDAGKRHHLSHAQVQMVRELGMSPKKLGGLDNHDQQPWKMPLPRYIEHLYFDRLHRRRPEVVRSIEEMVHRDAQKRAQRSEDKQRRRQARAHLEHE